MPPSSTLSLFLKRPFDGSFQAVSLLREPCCVSAGDPNFTFEVANKASKACGPLQKWVAAQPGLGWVGLDCWLALQMWLESPAVVRFRIMTNIAFEPAAFPS